MLDGKKKHKQEAVPGSLFYSISLYLCGKISSFPSVCKIRRWFFSYSSFLNSCCHHQLSPPVRIHDSFNQSLTPDSHTFSHKCFHVSNQSEIANLCFLLSLKPWAASVDSGIQHINAHMHTGQSDRWCPRGRVVKPRRLPPAILLFLTFHPWH